MLDATLAAKQPVVDSNVEAQMTTLLPEGFKGTVLNDDNNDNRRGETVEKLQSAIALLTSAVTSGFQTTAVAVSETERAVQTTSRDTETALAKALGDTITAVTKGTGDIITAVTKGTGDLTTNVTLVGGNLANAIGNAKSEIITDVDKQAAMLSALVQATTNAQNIANQAQFNAQNIQAQALASAQSLAASNYASDAKNLATVNAAATQASFAHIEEVVLKCCCETQKHMDEIQALNKATELQAAYTKISQLETSKDTAAQIAASQAALIAALTNNNRRGDCGDGGGHGNGGGNGNGGPH